MNSWWKKHDKTEMGHSKDFHVMDCQNCVDSINHWCMHAHDKRKIQLPSSQVSPKITIMPWLLECNPDRYPSWHGKVDYARLGVNASAWCYRRAQEDPYSQDASASICGVVSTTILAFFLSFLNVKI